MPGKKTAPKTKAPLATVQPKGAYLNKSELTNNLCVESGLSRKQARTTIEALQNIGTFELKKRGKFIMPGVARTYFIIILYLTIYLMSFLFLLW